MEIVSSAKEPKEKEGYDEWELESKANTLLQAEEIKADAKLMKAIQPFLNKKMKAYKSLADLKADAGLDGSVDGEKEA